PAPGGAARSPHHHFSGGVVRAEPVVRDRSAEPPRHRAEHRMAGPYRRLRRRVDPVCIVRSGAAAFGKQAHRARLIRRTPAPNWCGAHAALQPKLIFSICLLPPDGCGRMMTAWGRHLRVNARERMDACAMAVRNEVRRLSDATSGWTRAGRLP